MKVQCESCGIVGKGALCYEVISNYRDHNICGGCITEWNNREERAGKSISLEDFKQGQAYQC